jgi:ABC-type nitrate/sulfonate/bicarbonate transport system substrate-binding protein
LSSAVRARPNRLARVTALGGALLVSLLLTACGGDDDGSDASSSGDRTAIQYALAFTPNYVQAYFFTALDKGYYEEAGLDVDFVVPESSQTSTKLIGVGRAQLGEVIGIDPIPAIADDIPIRVISTFEPGPNLGLMAIPGEVDEVSDLAGEQVGVFGQFVYSEVCRPRLLEENGLSPDDVETVDIGFTSVPPLLTGKVAASEGGQEAELVSAGLETGEELNFFSYSDVCPNLPIEMIGNAGWMEENLEATTAFIEATLRGVKYTMENPTEARDIFIERFPDVVDPQENYDAVQGTFCPLSGDELGVNDQQQWEELIDLAVEGGAVDEELAYEDVVTDAYLPDDLPTTTAC